MTVATPEPEQFRGLRIEVDPHVRALEVDDVTKVFAGAGSRAEAGEARGALAGGRGRHVSLWWSGAKSSACWDHTARGRARSSA